MGAIPTQLTTPYDKTIFCLCIYRTKHENRVSKTPREIHKSQETMAAWLSTQRWIGKDNVVILSFFKKKTSLTTCYSMHELWSCYTTWNKPITSRWIHFDSIYIKKYIKCLSKENIENVSCLGWKKEKGQMWGFKDTCFHFLEMEVFYWFVAQRSITCFLTYKESISLFVWHESRIRAILGERWI